jgi:ABC-type uncharacterized transport system permease subunit
MTFLQQTLGKNYKWWYVYSYYLKIRTSSSWDSVLFVLGQLLSLVGVILIWYLSGNKLLDFAFQSKLTYFLVGEIFSCLIFIITCFEGFNIIRGNQTRIFLAPQNYFKVIFFRCWGDSSLQAFSKICFLFFFVILLSKYIIFYSFLNTFLALLFAFFGITISYFLESIISFCGFFLTRVNGVIMNFGLLVGLFSGKLFPLDLLIENFWVNLYNPFAYLFYHPMQIYLGKYSTNEILYTFLGGIAWCFVLWTLARVIFKLGLKKNEAVGL